MTFQESHRDGRISQEVRERVGREVRFVLNNLSIHILRSYLDTENSSSPYTNRDHPPSCHHSLTVGPPPVSPRHTDGGGRDVGVQGARSVSAGDGRQSWSGRESPCSRCLRTDKTSDRNPEGPQSGWRSSAGPDRMVCGSTSGSRGYLSSYFRFEESDCSFGEV